MTAKKTDLARTRNAIAEAEAKQRRNDLAIQAYKLKTEGYSWYEIAEELGISEGHVQTLISERIALAADLVDIGSKRHILGMELDRLDRLQRAVWPTAMTGDVRSVEAVLKVIDKRTKLLGLDQVTNQTVTANTIVVPGNTMEYIAALKAVQTQVIEEAS